MEDRLKEALHVFGQEYIDAIDGILRKEDKIASGDLIKSLKPKVIKTGFGTSYTLKIIAEEYLKYVDEGRRAGSKAPPIEPIRKWAKLKGLPGGLAFPIAKSIGIKGIKPTNVIQRAFDKVFKDISYRELEEGATSWVDDLITQKFKGISKNKNLTFK